MNSLAPRIAEFPTIEQIFLGGVLLEETPVRVVKGWVVNVYGSDEGSKLAGLPAQVIVNLYPEVVPGGVAYFSLIRETPAMEQVQDLLDAVATAMSVSHGRYRGEPKFRQELMKMGLWTFPGGQHFPARMKAEAGWKDDVPAAQELIKSLTWAVNETLKRSCPPQTKSHAEDDVYWRVEVYELALFVCAAHVGSPGLRNVYAKVQPELLEVFGILGLPELQKLTVARGRR